ncbi:MAG: hypothetical protein ACKOZW_00895, partial [Cyanobium sp.]
MGIRRVVGRSLRTLGRRSRPSGWLRLGSAAGALFVAVSGPLAGGLSAAAPAGGGLAAGLALIALAPAPAQAASALSAWRVSREGVLELRTSPGAALQAFFEDGSAGRGPRVWVD